MSVLHLAPACAVWALAPMAQAQNPPMTYSPEVFRRISIGYTSAELMNVGSGRGGNLQGVQVGADFFLGTSAYTISPSIASQGLHGGERAELYRLMVKRFEYLKQPQLFVWGGVGLASSVGHSSGFDAESGWSANLGVGISILKDSWFPVTLDINGYLSNRRSLSGIAVGISTFF